MMSSSECQRIERILEDVRKDVGQTRVDVAASNARLDAFESNVEAIHEAVDKLTNAVQQEVTAIAVLRSDMAKLWRVLGGFGTTAIAALGTAINNFLGK